MDYVVVNKYHALINIVANPLGVKPYCAIVTDK